MVAAVKIAETAFGSVVFFAFVWGVRGHFSSTRVPRGMVLVSLLSAVGYLVYIWTIWTGQLRIGFAIGGILVQGLGFWLFLATIRATREQRLTLAFDSDTPTFLILRGPYRFLRHPFYGSYIAFWIGCSVGTVSLACFAASVVLVFTYVFAARLEETKFEASDLREAYARYRSQVGFLWPRIGRV